MQATPKVISRGTKKWEVFPGRNRFCFDGRIIIGPDISVFYINIFLIVGTTLLFFIFDCPYLADKVSPIIPIVAVALFAFVVLSLLRTSFSDPGIIPRATRDEALYIERQVVSEMGGSGDMRTDRPPPRTKEIVIGGTAVKLKYCSTCKIFRPPRASHCSHCDNCVENFDHHCLWIGNCVGRRNYRYFYMFTISLSFYILFVFVCTCTHLFLLSEDKLFLDAVVESPTSMIVLAVTFFSCWSAFGLAGFHTYLAATNQTTNEDIKGSFMNKAGGPNKNPYSRGNSLLNCCYVLCGPSPPSLIDRHGLLSPDLVVERSKHLELSQRNTLHSPRKNAPSNNSHPPVQMKNSNTLNTFGSKTRQGAVSMSNVCIQIADEFPSVECKTAQNYANRSLPQLHYDNNNERPSSNSKAEIIYESVYESNYGRGKSVDRKKDPGNNSLSRNAADCDGSGNEKNAIRLAPLSASHLQMLQNTTMIESALDLDSLEESVSSAGAGSTEILVCSGGNNNRINKN